MKIKKVFMIFLISTMLIIPFNVKAASNNYGLSNYIQILDNVSEAQEARKNAETHSYEITQSTKLNQESDDEMKLCEDENFIKILKLIRTIIYIIMYAAAIVLVVRGILIFVQVVMSDKPELDKAAKNFGSKLVLGVVVFLLPTIFNWLFFSDNVLVQKSTYYKQCVSNVTGGKFFPELYDNSGDSYNNQ